MLAEVYGWFAEGCDTADLQEAKALWAALPLVWPIHLAGPHVIPLHWPVHAQRCWVGSSNPLPQESVIGEDRQSDSSTLQPLSPPKSAAVLQPRSHTTDVAGR